VNPANEASAVVRILKRPWLWRLLLPRIVLIAWATWDCFGSPARWLLAAQPGTSSGASQITSADGSPRAAEAVPPKVRRYAEHLLRRYDANGDGQLQPDEWGKMHGQPEAADTNGDHVITLDELTSRIAAFGQNRRVRLANPAIGADAGRASSTETPGRQGTGSDGPSSNGPEDAKKTVESDAESGPVPGTPTPRRDTMFSVPKSRLPAGLPEWFLGRDANGDGQLSLSEFAPNPTQADLEEFARYDKNGDGFITARECFEALKPAKAASGKAAGAGSGKPGETSGAKARRKKSGAAGN